MSRPPRRPSGPRNVLLQTGDHDESEESACMDLLGVDEPSAVDVLFVTFTGSPRERLDAWKRHADAPPANVGVVSVQVGGAGGDRAEGGPPVRRISDPSDLTGVGIAISEFLSEWSGNGNRTVVCFESVTALLQYVDANRVFQFLNEITSKFDQAGAEAHFHITPEAHERQVLSVLSSLFDDRVRPADLGGAPADDRGSAATAADSDPPDDEPADRHGEGDDTSDDPFEYAIGADAATGGPADDGPSEPATEPAETDGTVEPDGDDDSGDSADDPVEEGEDDPADLVSSVIAGEADAAESEASDEPTDESPDADEGTDPTEEGDDDPGRRPADREASRRRLEHVGPDADAPESTSAPDGPGETDEESTAEEPDRYALYQRTTAVVVGVVTMLVLISFLAAAVPMPIGTAPVDEAADVTPTATPEEAAAAGDAADAEDETTATATETATPTATPTETPTETATEDSGGSSASSGGSTSTATETATPTATETPTETATPTQTDSDDGLTGALDGEDDGDDGDLL